MARPKMLISGAGVGGEALASWMSRAGWQVCVVERAPSPRHGGQTVDLRGVSRLVIERMGLLAQAQLLAVPQSGMAWVDDNGRRLAEMPVQAFGGRGFVSAFEIQRGDLVQLLHTAAGFDTEHLFNDTIVAITDTNSQVLVDFQTAPSRAFDVVVGADGVHSAVRRLAFGPESDYAQPMGLLYAWFTVPARTDLDGWFLVHNAPGRRTASLRPGRRPGEHKAGMSFFSKDPSEPAGDRTTQLALLADRFTGVGWLTPYLIEQAGQADDFILDSFGQIHMPDWTIGRIGLIGDAAHCPSPLSGQGTALALIGAYLLAGELAAVTTSPTSADIHQALHRYQHLIRPHVEKAQRLPPARLASFAPKTALGIRTNAAAMRAIQRWPLRPIINQRTKKSQPTYLPDHKDTRPIA